MLRRAYAQGTDLRLYVTPLHAAMRELLVALGLGERYESWLRELVRINEQEAVRAGRQPLPLWDFSDPNTTVTSTAFGTVTAQSGTPRSFQASTREPISTPPTAASTS